MGVRPLCAGELRAFFDFTLPEPLAESTGVARKYIYSYGPMAAGNPASHAVFLSTDYGSGNGDIVL